MAGPLALIWDLIARDQASPAFTRVAVAADKAATATQRTTAQMNTAAASMSRLGSSLTKSVTLPLAGLAAVSIDQAAKFQKSMTLLQTAGGETAAKMTQISSGIKNLAIETGTSLSQLNAGMYTVAKFGSKFSATDQLLILKAAAEGAKAENVDLGTATNALTTVMQSYGAKASDAVAIQNELVVAAGKSKTTMSDFAQSLSNVVPLASSLGIGFDQVGAAIATMTQHGESAQQSTDNLNNLIRNLAGQNNVASAAMQQLGINTIDLRKNLAQNGLTGTLQVVEDALARSSKGGLVVVSAFKQAALATQSLDTMLGRMTGDLKNQSEGLLKGSVSIKDYRTYARDLGGTAGAAALQFLSLYQQSQGFSDALKSGNSTVSTAAAQLQKMLGGATGLNVALMLGGNSAKTFTSDVSAIGAAAKQSGSNISTWAQTQSTLAVKTDQARQRIAVMAVDMGEKLLPVAEDVIGDVSKMVNWFSHLSTGTQGVIIKVGLFAAALGPVLSITGRLVKTASTVIGWMGRLSGSFATTAAAASTAAADEAVNAAAWARLEAEKAEATAASARAIAASLAGTDSLLAEDAAAAATNAEEFAAAQQAKAAAAEAAAIKIRAAGVGEGAGGAAAGAGAAAGGSAVLGTASLAAVAGAAYFGGKALSNTISASTDAAIVAVGKFGKALKELGTNIKDANGALTQQTALTVATQLQSDGLAAKAKAAGIDLATLTEGITGTDAQYKQLVATWKAGGKPSSETIFALNMIHDLYESAGTAAAKAAAQQGAAQKAAAKVASDAAAAAKRAAQEAYDAAHPELATFTADLTGARTAALSVKAATDAFVVSLGRLAVTGKTAQVGLGDSGGAAGTAADHFKEAAQNAISLAGAMQAQGASNEQVATTLENNVIALEAQAEKLGLNKSAVDSLIQSMNLTPSEIDTYFNVDIAAALANIATLKAELASLGAQIDGGGATDAETRAQGTKIAGQLGAAKAKLLGSLSSLGKNVSSRTTSGGGQGGLIGGGGAGGGSGGSGGSSGSSALSAFKTALSNFTSAVQDSTSTADQLKTAVKSLMDAAKKAGVSSTTLAKVSKDQSALLIDATRRDALMTSLSNLKSAYSNEASTVAGAIKSTFNLVGSAWSSDGSYTFNGPVAVQSTLANIASAVSQAQTFSGTVGRLSKTALGKTAAGRELLQQIVEAGPQQGEPEAAALANATPAQIAQLVASQAKLDAIANATGENAANTIQGQQLKAIENQTKVLTAHIDSIGKQVASALDGTARNSRNTGSSKPAGR